MLKEPKKIKPEPDLSYHWYVSQKIMETKSGKWVMCAFII
jgi:hypothetical protein